MFRGASRCGIWREALQCVLLCAVEVELDCCPFYCTANELLIASKKAKASLPCTLLRAFSPSGFGGRISTSEVFTFL